MKKCHFSILYNELPFLKQKLPFLYERFEQLIFFDLNVGTYNPHFSTDGSHEFIQDYPDPANKITLINETDISGVQGYCGGGSIEKQKMFALGSRYVNDDIDVFWCTDLDEFFHEAFIDEVEECFRKFPEVNSIDLEHYIFWKNFEYILCYLDKDTRPLFARVCRHKKGNIYSHCAIQDQFPQTLFLENQQYYHFSWVGNARVKNKFHHYSRPPTGSPQNIAPYEKYWKDVWMPFDESMDIEPGEIFGYPHMHPNPAISMGIKKFAGNLPSYVNYSELKRDLDLMTQPTP